MLMKTIIHLKSNMRRLLRNEICSWYEDEMDHLPIWYRKFLYELTRWWPFHPDAVQIRSIISSLVGVHLLGPPTGLVFHMNLVPSEVY